MLQLDKNWLAQQGITGLGDDDVQSLLQYVYGELELRVGMKLSENLTDDQLKEFEQLATQGTDQQQLQWLETNCPDYKNVVQQELERLGHELRQNRDLILPGAAEAQQMPQQPLSPTQHPMQSQQQYPQPQQHPQQQGTQSDYDLAA